MKQCTKCGETQPLSEFTRLKSSSDGLSYRCKECQRIKRRAEYLNNKESIAASNAAWRVKNAARMKELQRAWNARNPDRVREQAHRSYHRNKDSNRIGWWRARARKYNADCGCVTKETVESVWDKDADLCAYCGAPGEHLDHVVSLSRGGMHCTENMRVACARCNHMKHANPVELFLERLAGSGIEIRSGALSPGYPCERK